MHTTDKSRHHRNLKDVEPFVDNDGQIGFIILSEDPHNPVKTLSEWKDFNPELGKELEEEWLDKIPTLIWLLPGRPDIMRDDPNLVEDLISFMKGIVELPSEKMYALLASFVISSYIIEGLDFAPRIIVSGPTEHGKGRVLRVAQHLAYRAAYLGDPTLAVIYRLTGFDHATVLIDELQDLPEETRNRILGCLKLGFEVGAVVPRMNSDNSDYESFQTYSFWMVVGKNIEYPEDVQNRSIIITMKKKTGDVRGPPKNDDVYTRSLRARLLAFRVRWRLNFIDIEPLKQKVEQYLDGGYEASSKDVTKSPIRIEMSDRTRDKARTLLIPCMIFGHAKEILDVLVESQIRSKDEQRNTLEAQVFYALQECMRRTCHIDDPSKLRDLSDESTKRAVLTGVKRISVNDITIQLNDDIAEKEGETAIVDDSYNHEKIRNNLKDRVKTKTVGTTLRNLSFRTRKGTGNKHHVDSKEFLDSYRSCIQSFGSRYDVDQERD